MGEELVSQVADWLPMADWVALTVDDTGRVRALGMAGLTPATEHAATVVGALVIRSGAVFCCADLIRRIVGCRPRRRACRLAAIGLPLECRGRTVGALVGFDRFPSGKNPQFTPATLDGAALSAGAGSHRAR